MSTTTAYLCRKCLRAMLGDGTPCECQGGPVIDWEERSREHWEKFWRERRKRMDEAVLKVLTNPE